MQIDTDPPRLRLIDKSEYAEYVKYAKYGLISVALALFQHRNVGALVVLHASVCLCMDFEKEQKFAEPDVIHSELKSAIRYPRRAAQLVAACRREHCYYLQDHRVARQARHRRLKVRILITETNSGTEYMQYA